VGRAIGFGELTMPKPLVTIEVKDYNPWSRTGPTVRRRYELSYDGVTDQYRLVRTPPAHNVDDVQRSHYLRTIMMLLTELLQEEFDV
jgi:hypothetical protein